MLNELSTSLQNIITLIKVNSLFVLKLIAILWIIQIINFILRYRLNFLGIYPRHLFGLPGIVCSPFLHGNFNHLFFNSIPLFLLINLILFNGRAEFYCISIMIILLSGMALWLFGRRAIHIGSSTLIMGYFGYLLINAYHQPTMSTILLAAFCIYYFGGLFLALIPGEKGISWEGHLFGFLAGVAAAFLCPIM
ncbi:MAG: rhomboid family intramembrane serine protease [Gammaproteobacteria bacterium]|jgi:membrane associated rhomboid family serine protease